MHRPSPRECSETWKRCWRLPHRYLRHHPLQYDYLLSKFIWSRHTVSLIHRGIWPSSSTSNVNQWFFTSYWQSTRSVGSAVIELLFQNDELLFLTKIPPWSRDWELIAVLSRRRCSRGLSDRHWALARPDWMNFEFRISIQLNNISIVDNFFLKKYFWIKIGTKNEPSLKTPNLQGFLLTPNSLRDRSFGNRYW